MQRSAHVLLILLAQVENVVCDSLRITDFVVKQEDSILHLHVHIGQVKTEIFKEVQYFERSRDRTIVY